MPALPIGAIVAGVGSLAGGALSSAGAGAQANAALQASAAAIAEQKRQFDEMQKMFAPWLQTGSGALAQLAHLLGISYTAPAAGGGAGTTTTAAEPIPMNLLQYISQRDELGEGTYRDGAFYPAAETTSVAETAAPSGAAPSSTLDPSTFGSLMKGFTLADFEKEPGYEFRLAEGSKALERSAAARGTQFSGSTLKALDRYTQGYASDEFARAFDRFNINRNTRYNFLANIAGLGQSTATTLGGYGARSAENIGNLIVGGQTAAAAARASGYNSWANTIQNIGNIPLTWYRLSQVSGGR